MTTDMHTERIATALERIADALEGGPVPRNPNHAGLSAAWDACEVADGYLGGSGAARPKLIVSTASDPLDESDHRPRHFVDGGGDVIGTHLYRHGDRHWHSYPVEYLPCNQGCRLALTKWADIPLTFCDCDPTDSDRATD